MTISKQLEYCKKCENQKFDKNKGIVCVLTNEKPNFKDKCPDYKELESVKKYSAYKKDTKKVRYPALELIANLLSIFGWIVGIITIAVVIFSFTSEPVNVISSVILLISGIFIAILNIALSELIKVFINIEENTRKYSN